MRIEYSHLDARLRWYGPEVVLRDVRVLDRDGSQALFATREGSVGLDVWNFFRTGQFVAGRVHFVGPSITVVRLADGRIRLLGQSERPVGPSAVRPGPTARGACRDRGRHGGVSRPEDRSGAAATRRPGTHTAPRSRFRRRWKVPHSCRNHWARASNFTGAIERLARRTQASCTRASSCRHDELRLAGLQGHCLPNLAGPVAGRGATRIVVAVGRTAASNARESSSTCATCCCRCQPAPYPPVEAVQISPVQLVARARQAAVSDRGQDRGAARRARRCRRTVRYAVLQGDLRLRKEAGSLDFQWCRDCACAGHPRATPAAAARIVGKYRGRPSRSRHSRRKSRPTRSMSRPCGHWHWRSPQRGSTPGPASRRPAGSSHCA